MILNKKKIFLLVCFVIVSLVMFFISRVSFIVREKPRLIKTILEMDKVRDLLSEYKKICDKYPLSISSFESLSENVKNKNCSGNAQDINAFSDKWGNFYFYKSDENGFRLLSAGYEWIEATNSSETKKIEKGDYRIIHIFN